MGHFNPNGGTPVGGRTDWSGSGLLNNGAMPPPAEPLPFNGALAGPMRRRMSALPAVGGGGGGFGFAPQPWNGPRNDYGNPVINAHPGNPASPTAPAGRMAGSVDNFYRLNNPNIPHATDSHPVNEGYMRDHGSWNGNPQSPFYNADGSRKPDFDFGSINKPALPDAPMPPAPPRLSTMTCCLSGSASRCATTRARMSLPPPGGKGTIRRMGREGYGWP